MAVELVMPRLSESMEHGTIVSWLVPDGAQVWQGDEIAEIETDKATLPYEAPETGVLRILVPEGSTLALGEPIGLIDDLAPLPGGQSVPPPGTAPATARAGRVPPPRHPSDDPATASFELQPELHEAPHTLHASTPPPASRDTAWSPAWGPQPARPQPAPVDQAGDDEGETTEFAAIDPSALPEPQTPPAATPPAAVQPAVAPPIQAAPVPPAPVEDRAAVLADDGSHGYGPLFGDPEPAPQPTPTAPAVAPENPATSTAPAALGDVTPDQAAADAVAADARVEAQVAAMPWVDTSLGRSPAIDDDRRFTPDELIAPQTLPPRPPELQPTASAARVKASPVARRLARELGIDLSTLTGTGPEGRVVRADIEAALATGAARPPRQTAAAPTAASEFTPPVDASRAAAPIPPVEPTPEPAPAPAPAQATPEPAEPAAQATPAPQSAEASVEATPEPDPAEVLVEAAAEVAEALTAGAVAGAVSAPLSPADLAEDVPAKATVVAIEADAAVVVLDDLAPPTDPATGAGAPSPAVSRPDAHSASVPDGAPAHRTDDEPAEASEIAIEADAAVVLLDDLAPGHESAAAPAPEAAQAAEPTVEAAQPAAPAPQPAESAAPATEPVASETTEPEPEAPTTNTSAEAATETPVPDTPAAETRVLPAAQPGGGKGEPTTIELTRQQQTVARRMAESKATIPDFHTVVEVDAAPLLALRAELIATRPDLAAPSVNDLLVKATAIALRAFPALNGAYRDGRLEQYPRVNIGIAVDADGKLLVPVVHDADNLSVSQIAARTNEVVGKARDGSLRPPDIASATFTLSNLGAFGIERFTAVITPGQAGILTAGAIADRPVVRDGAVVAGQTLVLTLTTDHRAIYGAQAAAFLGRVKQLLERPSSLLA